MIQTPYTKYVHLTANMPTDAVTGQMCRPFNISTADTLRENVRACVSSLHCKASALFTGIYKHLRVGVSETEQIGYKMGGGP